MKYYTENEKSKKDQWLNAMKTIEENHIKNNVGNFSVAENDLYDLIDFSDGVD